MIGGSLAAVLALLAAGHGDDAGDLPYCSNRVVNEVVARAGCTVGDTRCWVRSGGFCTDWIEARVVSRWPGRTVQLAQVDAAHAEPGDVAVFASRAHYAVVERVVRGEDGAAAAVDVSEYNFGSCWVDRDAMVTDAYEVEGRRHRVPVTAVDGGFLRPVPVAR